MISTQRLIQHLTLSKRIHTDAQMKEDSFTNHRRYWWSMWLDLKGHYFHSLMNVDDRHNSSERSLNEQNGSGVKRRRTFTIRTCSFLLHCTATNRCLTLIELRSFSGGRLLLLLRNSRRSNKFVDFINGLQRRMSDTRSSVQWLTLFTLNGFPKTCCLTGCASISLNGGACPFARGYSS